MVELDAYRMARQRCNNQQSKDFSNYGGRGIKFLFTSFKQFFAELGPRPDGMSLERINNNGHYEPGNVRWATWSDQMRNRRSFPRAAKLRINTNECKHGHVGSMYLCGTFYRCRKCDYIKNKRSREKRKQHEKHN